jgi:hypothetical protein
MLRHAKKSLFNRLRIHMLIYSILTLLCVYIGADRNPHISLAKGLFIGLGTAFLLIKAMRMSFNYLIGASAVQRFFIGAIWGVILGLGTGIVFGWGGGISGYSMMWFLVVGPVLIGDASGLNALLNLKFPNQWGQTRHSLG